VGPEPVALGRRGPDRHQRRPPLDRGADLAEERERLVSDILYQFRKFGVTEMAPELTDEQKAHMKYMSDTWPG